MYIILGTLLYGAGRVFTLEVNYSFSMRIYAFASAVQGHGTYFDCYVSCFTGFVFNKTNRLQRFLYLLKSQCNVLQLQMYSGTVTRISNGRRSGYIPHK